MKNEAHTVLAGFLRAEYGANGEKPWILTIGETIASGPTRVWITAWNPLGAQVPADENAFAQARLCAGLTEVGLKFDLGFARSPSRQAGAAWFEPCAVVIDPPIAFIDALARAYRQLAVVVASPSEPARLRCYRECWLSRFGLADIGPAGVDCGLVDWIA